jgi:hypothetical protein
VMRSPSTFLISDWEKVGMSTFKCIPKMVKHFKFRLLEDFNLKHGLSHSDLHTEFVSFYLPQIALSKDPATPPNVTSQDGPAAGRCISAARRPETVPAAPSRGQLEASGCPGSGRARGRHPVKNNSNVTRNQVPVQQLCCRSRCRALPPLSNVILRPEPVWAALVLNCC